MPDRRSSFRHGEHRAIRLISDLREYLRGGSRGTAGARQSNAIAMIAEMAGAWAEIECPACKRRRYRRRKRRALASAEPERSERVREAFAAAGWSLSRARELIDWIEDDRCKRCCGTGRVRVRVTDLMRQNPEITRFPTGSSKHGKPPETVGDTQELERMGRIGNLLVQMTARDPEAAAALKAWATMANIGVVCVFEHTESGRVLLSFRPKDDLREPLRFFVDEQRRRDSGYTDHTRDRWFERSEREARELLDCAVMLWNELVDDSDADRTRRHRVAARKEARQLLERSRRAGA